MIKKMLGVFTAVVTALAVVGVAYAGTDDGASTSVTAAGDSSTSVSIDDSSSSTDATSTSSTDATIASSPQATLDSTTSTSIDDHDDDTTTSTTIDSTTSTSIDDHDDNDDDTTTSTTIDSTTSTSFDDSDSRVVPDGVSTYQIPGVGTVTVEVVAGRLALVNVSAPGWEIEEQRVEADRVELELVSGEAEAEFRARINNGEIEVRVEVD